jgi:two-component system, NarL family, sensor histidine kinase UhpB
MDKGSASAKHMAQKRSLTLLIVGPSPEDAELCLLALAGIPRRISCDVVRRPEEFVERLRATRYDAILSDYRLGTWTGMDALELMRKERTDVPLILVTEALGDQKAVDCMKSGAADYVLKDHLERLPGALLGAVEQRELQDERREADELLRSSEQTLRRLVESIPIAVFIEQGTRCCYVNEAAEATTEYSRRELLNMNFWQLIHRESKEEVLLKAAEASKRNLSLNSFRHDVKIVTKHENVRWLTVNVGMFQLDGGLASLITAFDITDTRQMEALNSPVYTGAELQ